MDRLVTLPGREPHLPKVPHFHVNRPLDGGCSRPRGVGDPYVKLGDACCLGCKSRILVSLRVLITKRHLFIAQGALEEIKNIVKETL